MTYEDQEGCQVWGDSLVDEWAGVKIGNSEVQCADPPTMVVTEGSFGIHKTCSAHGNAWTTRGDATLHSWLEFIIEEVPV